MKKMTLYFEAATLVLVVIILLVFLIGTDSRQRPPVDAGDKGLAGIATGDLGQQEQVPLVRRQKKTIESSILEAEETAVPEDVWIREKWVGDFSAMVKRRMIRALVPPSKTFFFLDKGRKRGLTYESLMAFETYINKQLKSKHM